MSSASISTERIALKISDLEARLKAENAASERDTIAGGLAVAPGVRRPATISRPKRLCDPSSPLPPRHEGTPTRSRKELALHGLPTYTQNRPQESAAEIDAKMKEIMRQTGVLTIEGKQSIGSQKYQTEESDLEHLGDLGYGTCGHVVKMLHRPSKTVIAVKQMRRSGNREEEKRIIMDIEVVLKSHDCPFIVQCLGCFITDADVWICMELMATCFDKLLKRIKKPLPEDVLGNVTVATVKALHYLKETHGVIHRDVKPSNILLDERGIVKLCDFGISGRLVDSKAKTRGAGCAAYMAPERIDPPNPTNPDYDIRADVWSLGITLVELASGHFPYTNCKTDFEVLTKVINEDPPSLPADQSFSPEFQNFVSSCLTKNYQKRPKYRKLLKDPFILKYENAEFDLARWYASTFETSTPPALVASETAVTNLTSTAVQTNSSPIQSSSKPSPSYSNASTNTVASPTSCLSPTYVNASTNTPVTSPIRKYTPPSSGSSISQASPTPPRRQGVFNHSQFHHRNLSDPRHHEQYIRHHEQPHRFYQYHDQPIYGRPSEPRLYSNERLHPDLPPTIPPRIYPADQRKRHPSEPHQILTSANGTPPPPIYHRAFSFSPPPPPASAHRPHSPDKWFASYLQLQLGRRSPLPQQPSAGPPIYARSPPPIYTEHIYQRDTLVIPPSPPPRSSRLQAEESPRLRRGFLDTTRRSLGAGETRYFVASPSMPRRHVSPAPPEPPPRRINESMSVPGSPQHGRVPPFRLQYQSTPEPQRRTLPDGGGGGTDLQEQL
ncbi:dual specificity mitogen-activated protein kinase kinase 7-like isoform X2 [Neocloeon triangulifer]|uniref:dual specificity mitogen-activated protein kinase kinase 7-like isoform X2 n=1 Tax=Neocloeon triangulifer TaxID=2078957 RepID=UPI00286F358B|nr:dual specificity mitogen-activated protein kinase kinase 7-like isoform X2 [Neocloeon triangulifer]